MQTPFPTPSARLQGVATPVPGPLDSSGRCQRCGRPIPKPRPRQKACSSRCRWALWKAGQARSAQALVQRDREIQELLNVALRKLEGR